MYARLVAVVEQYDVAGEAMQQPNLIDRECRARVSHNVLQSALVHGDNIGIALYHIDTVLLGYGVLGLEDTVELTLLMVDIRIGRVDILLGYTLRPGVEHTATEGHHLTADVQPREDNTASIAVA